VADVKAAPVVLVAALETNPHLVQVLADQGYRGRIATLLQQAYGCAWQLTEKLGQGFMVQPWRWVVERTFAWLENARRLCRDYEELPQPHESFIYITMIRLMLRKLTGNQRSR